MLPAARCGRREKERAGVDKAEISADTTVYGSYPTHKNDKVITIILVEGQTERMDEQKKLAKRIDGLCRQQGISYYKLAYRSAVPLTTLMHIIDCSTKNPGIFTIIKICDGLNITISEFFNTEDFIGIESETE